MPLFVPESTGGIELPVPPGATETKMLPFDKSPPLCALVQFVDYLELRWSPSTAMAQRRGSHRRRQLNAPSAPMGCVSVKDQRHMPKQPWFQFPIPSTRKGKYQHRDKKETGGSPSEHTGTFRLLNTGDINIEAAQGGNGFRRIWITTSWTHDTR